MYFSTKKFIIVWLSYSIVSTILFIFTSHGWTAFLLVPAGAGIFYGGTLLLIALITLVLQTKGLVHIFISHTTLKIILMLQFLAILVNTGDCGGADGNSTFILSIFGFSNCSVNSGSGPSLYWTLSITLYLILAIAYLVALGKIYWSSAVRHGISTRPLTIIYGTTLLVLSIIAVYIFSEDYRYEKQFQNTEGQIRIHNDGIIEYSGSQKNR